MIDEYGEKMVNFKLEPLLYSKWAQITDLMRLEIVHNNGGYYFDTTFEILKPLYNLLNKKKYTFIGCNEIPRFKNVDILSNSFFGATKNNPILKRLLSKRRLNKIDFYDMAVDFQTGPGVKLNQMIIIIYSLLPISTHLLKNILQVKIHPIENHRAINVMGKRKQNE